ncbi:MAG: hypothetical protein ACLTMP_10545 [Eggerthella lenta]
MVPPLRRAGMTKDDVRAASRELWACSRPTSPASCIAVHVGGSSHHRPGACRDGRTPGVTVEAPVSRRAG